MNTELSDIAASGISAICLAGRFPILALALASSTAFAAGNVLTNPPGCDRAAEDCGCSCRQVSADCIKVELDLGTTTPWTGSVPCALKIFADDTPTISLVFDALGRQIEVRDAAGLTTFAYDSFGSLTNETVVGVAGTNVIERYWDEFGRLLGCSLNWQRRTTLAYEADMGRIASMFAAGATNLFHWSYLPGSDLKSSLVYPNLEFTHFLMSRVRCTTVNKG